jgi:hypothetical protein
MKRFFTLIARLLLLILLPGFVFAQQTKNYDLLLNSGKFLPAENINQLSKSDDVFSKSSFENKNYLTIQFRELPNQATKDRMSSAGIQLMDYIPNLAYTAVVSSAVDMATLRSFPIRSIIQFSTEQKTVPALLKGTFPAYAIKKQGYVDLTIITYEKLEAIKIAPVLSGIGATILEDMPMFRSFTVRVADKNAKKLAGLPFVQWAEFIDPPNQSENLLGRTLHRVNILNDGVRNLKGNNIHIGIWDEGEVFQHLDFTPVSTRLHIMEPGSVSSHSTHCAGTLGGRGLINPKARGMASNAEIFSYNFSGNIQTEMANAIPANNLVVSSHSYGSTQTCGLNGAGVIYSATSRATDLNLNTFPFHLHVHSSGNSQGACAGGWSTITASGKTAKNNILVANITTAEVLSSTSSCGPVQDGRVKPEISAFGTGVLSTYPNNNYGTISGTSMATPGIAGSVSLLVERYRQLNGNANPISSLIKNTVLNTAFDLGNVGPDYRFGYGRINALAAVKILEQNRYVINTIATSGQNDITVNVPAGAARLRVMLTWNDPAGAANANPALVNNLDLSVINGPTTSLPWVLDPNNPAVAATNGVDNVSNIEQVVINNPAAGAYTVRVAGTLVPTGPNQEYSLTWDIEQPAIEVLFPNGGESFDPTSQETITWDNTGVTSNQTVEYSLNNGTNWTTISSSVPANVTRLIWNVPSGANTSTALIRVTSGSLSDVSDNNFRILGTTTGFNASGATCNPGEITFTWGAVSNATHYDIYSLDATNGQFVILASDITATTHTATGLTPGASMWFNIVAKNNSTGAVGEKSNAINATVSTGGGGMGPIGSISGPTTVCGTPTNVPYTIPAVTGATLYTWSAPPGATIASGQGTTNIAINYPGGSSSGNVSVFASSGSCQTITVTLPVTVSGASVAAPTSGGNQTSNVCSPNPVPTLTATATVPGGHTVVWYNAATGGAVVSNPILNAAGTVTYYAASRNTSSGCESNTRTAVTLTITVAPAVSATASGALTFCDGGSVTLTANAGASYLWSNGATSQSIIVTTGGSYSVTVTNANGCVGTSTPITVTVNATPSATVSADGPTSFCQGNDVVLSAPAGAASYLWSNGATSQSITVTTSGNYSVVVTNANGCSANSGVTTVTVSPSPVVSLTASPYTKLYPGITTNLTATVTPADTYTYVWSLNGSVVTGFTGPTITGISLSGLGTYSVRATNAGGCSGESNIVSILDSAIKRLFIYPSPTSTGQFVVTYHSSVPTTYQMHIYDSKGALVFNKSYNNVMPYELMDVQMLTAGKGIYTVVLSDNSGKRIATGRVVIQ